MKHSLSIHMTLFAALLSCGAHAASAQARPADDMPNRAGIDSLDRHVRRNTKTKSTADAAAAARVTSSGAQATATTAKVRRSAPPLAEIRGAPSAPNAFTAPAPARAISTATDTAPAIQRSARVKKPSN